MEQLRSQVVPCLSRGCVHIIDAERRISSIQSIAYHQTEANFMHGKAVMICKGQALDDIPNLASLRFGYKKSRTKSRDFLVTRTIPLLLRGLILLCNITFY